MSVFRFLAIRLACLLLVLAATACEGPPKADPPDTTTGPAAPTYAEIATRHNRRVAALSRVHGEGVMELRWTDDAGKHFEQGDADLWLELPTRTGLRVSKFGDVLLWLGSDADRYWLFDLFREPTTLITAGHDRDLRTFGDGMVSVRPLALVDLVGLSPLPVATGSGTPAVSWSTAHNGWSLIVPGRAGERRRYLFAKDTLLPTRIESIDAEGRVALESFIRDYRRIDLPNAALSNRPEMGEVISIVDPAGRGEVKLYLRRWSDPGESVARLFDLDRLTRSMRPERVARPSD